MKRVEKMAELDAENGRPMPTVGVVPPTTIAKTEEEAWAGHQRRLPARLGERTWQVVGEEVLPHLW